MNTQKFDSSTFLKRGTYGDVWKIKKGGEEYAMKRQDSFDDEMGTHGHIIRELDILSRFSHPNCVKLKKVYHSDTHIDMLMELYEKNLEEFISERSWDKRKEYMNEFFYQMIDTIVALHESHIYHMDIKAQNFLYKDGKLSICDFGLASMNNDDSLCVNLCTIYCRPPELLKRILIDKREFIEGCCDKIDVWALGCVMVEYILGYSPFMSGNNEESTLLSILNEDSVENLTNLPFNIPKNFQPKSKIKMWKMVLERAPAWYDLIRSMLSVDYRKRPNSKRVWEFYLNIAIVNGLQTNRKLYSITRKCVTNVNQDVQDKISSILGICGIDFDIKEIASLYLECMENEFMNRYDKSDVLESCIYIGIKYKLYDARFLKDVIFKRNQEKILELEKFILSICKYKIGT